LISRIAFLSTVLVAGGAVAQPAVGPEFDCLIEARQALDIRSPVEGVIETVYVQRGASVKKGQTLALLYSGPERAAFDLARSRAGNEGEIKAAEARVDLTKKKYERAAELVKKNFVSEAARDDAVAEYRLAL
jgi:multidrug efflux pump subunit AcrA (membrane-fusion protein)